MEKSKATAALHDALSDNNNSNKIIITATPTQNTDKQNKPKTKETLQNERTFKKQQKLEKGHDDDNKDDEDEEEEMDLGAVHQKSSSQHLSIVNSFLPRTNHNSRRLSSWRRGSQLTNTSQSSSLNSNLSISNGNNNHVNGDRNVTTTVFDGIDNTDGSNSSSINGSGNLVEKRIVNVSTKDDLHVNKETSGMKNNSDSSRCPQSKNEQFLRDEKDDDEKRSIHLSSSTEDLSGNQKDDHKTKRSLTATPTQQDHNPSQETIKKNNPVTHSNNHISSSSAITASKQNFDYSSKNCETDTKTIISKESMKTTFLERPAIHDTPKLNSSHTSSSKAADIQLTAPGQPNKRQDMKRNNHSNNQEIATNTQKKINDNSKLKEKSIELLQLKTTGIQKPDEKAFTDSRANLTRGRRDISSSFTTSSATQSRQHISIDTSSGTRYTVASHRRPAVYQIKPPESNSFSSGKLVQNFSLLCSNERVWLEDLSKWESILSFDTVSCVGKGQEAFDLYLSTLDSAQSMINYEQSTGNFGSLLLILLSFMRYKRMNAYAGNWSKEAYNSLFLIRLFVQYFIELLEPDVVGCMLEGQGSMPVTPLSAVSTSGRRLSIAEAETKKVFIDPQVLIDKRKKMTLLLDELMQCLIYADFRESETTINHDFYVIVLDILILIFSSHLFQSMEEIKSTFFTKILFEQSHFSRLSVTKLLSNIIEKPHVPSKPDSNSLGLFFGAYNYFFASKTNETPNQSMVGDKSLFLLLILFSLPPKSTDYCNPFLNVVGTLEDSQMIFFKEKSHDLLNLELEISFSEIYDSLIDHHNEGVVILNYYMIQKNKEFMTYSLSRTDPETMILPLIKSMYQAITEGKSYTSLYLILPILLAFMEDESFVEILHKIHLSTLPTWYVDKTLKSISCAGLIVVMLMRLLSYNLSSHKDAYIHSAAIGLFYTITSKTIHIHPTIAQKLVGFFEQVTKRYSRMDANELNEVDIIAYEDVLSVICEVINAILLSRIRENAPLIYALLHKKQYFAIFKTHFRIGPLISNILTVFTIVEPYVAELDLSSVSLEEVYDMLSETIKFSMSKLKLIQFEPLKFYQVETQESYKFLLAFVWLAVYKSGYIYWEEENLRLISDIEFDPAASPLKGSLSNLTMMK